MDQETLRKKFAYRGVHFLDQNGNLYSVKDKTQLLATAASTRRRVADLSLFDTTDPKKWEQIYCDVLEVKYQKTTRNFSRVITGRAYGNDKEPPVYLIPRTRGGPSYKEVNLKGVTVEDIAFMPISKGFSMQGLSSFTVGPIVGEGLCLVNAAFSKSICLFHIEGGQVDLKRINFWRPKHKPERDVELIDEDYMLVDGVKYLIVSWLKYYEDLWFPGWDKWRKCVALCSRGDFHWSKGQTLVYRHGKNYLSFVDWKKKCYITPSYQHIPETPEYKFLLKVWKQEHRALGLVHPMARSISAQKPITREILRHLFDSDEIMCCQPYVVAARLMDVVIYEEKDQNTNQSTDSKKDTTIPCRACKIKPYPDGPGVVLNKEGICSMCWEEFCCQICSAVKNGLEDMLWSCRDCQRISSTCCEGLGWCQCSTNICKDCLPKYYKCYCDTCDHEVSWPVTPFIVDDACKYLCSFCKKKSYFSHRDIRDKSAKN